VKLRLVFGAYVLVAMAMTYPLVLAPFDHVLGTSVSPGEATPPLNIWAMHTVLQQLLHDPLHLYDGTAFYPYPRTVTLSEHLLAPALLGAPVAWLTGNLVLAYNVVTLLTFALAGLGMYLLTREIAGDGLPAFAAGLFYAFHSWNLNEAVRLQILSNQWFPFLLLALLWFFKQPTARNAALASLFYLLQAFSCMYWGLYVHLMIAATLVFLQWRERLPVGALSRLAIAFAPALLLFALSALPYLETSRELGLERRTPNALLLERYLQVLPNNWLYGGLLRTARSNENAAHFLGFASLALVVLGILASAPEARFRRLKPYLLFLVTCGFVLSLGPLVQVGQWVLFRGPYDLLFSVIPGFKNTRYPERLSVFLALGLAPLVALGMERLRPRLGRLGLGLLTLLIPLEHLAIPQSLSELEAGNRIPTVYRWLKDQDDIHVVAEVPSVRYLMERADARLMYWATVHGKRTVEGYTSYFPPTYSFAKWRLFHFPEPASVAFLERFGVDAVVVRPANGVAPEWTRGDPRWKLVGPFAEGHVVLRLGKGQPFEAPPADWAGYTEIPRPRYGVAASSPGAERAVDDDPQTTWEAGRRRENWYRINFSEPQRLSRIAIQLGHAAEFPIGLKLFGRPPEGGMRAIRFDKPAVLDRLFSSLLFEPRNPVMVVAFETQELASISLEIAKADPFGLPWSMHEVRVYAPR